MLKQAKISQYRQRKILKYFCEDISASKTAKLLGFNRKTVDLYYGLFRDAIMCHSIEKQSKQFNGEVEIDESYFGARRVRGKRGRGADACIWHIEARRESLCSNSKKLLPRQS